MKTVRRYWEQFAKNVTPLRKIKLQDQINPNQFMGKKLLARRAIDGTDEEVDIQEIKGSLRYPKQFQINGSHFCHMFSFYSQMLDGRVPTDEEMAEFELASDVKGIKEINGKKES